MRNLFFQRIIGIDGNQLPSTCGCEWEEEHGLQLVFKEGKKLTRISGYDGHITAADAYDIPDEQDELLSKC